MAREHRSGDAGCELLDAAPGHARENGLARLVVSPSQRSVPFYEGAGFTPATELLVQPLD